MEYKEFELPRAISGPESCIEALWVRSVCVDGVRYEKVVAFDQDAGWARVYTNQFEERTIHGAVEVEWDHRSIACERFHLCPYERYFDVCMERNRLQLHSNTLTRILWMLGGGIAAYFMLAV